MFGDATKLKAGYFIVPSESDLAPSPSNAIAWTTVLGFIVTERAKDPMPSICCPLTFTMNSSNYQ